MLTTQEQHTWDMPNALTMRGEIVFSRAWFGIQAPLFFSVFVEETEAGPCLLQEIGTDLQSVLQAIADNENRRLKSLQLMSPPHMNGTKLWQLEVVDRILLPRGARLGDSLEIYEVAGKRYQTELAEEHAADGEAVLYDAQQFASH